MRVIYIDVLILINLYVTYFLIRSTNIFMHKSLSSRKCFFSAGIGSISSLLIFFPDLNFIIVLLIKIAFAAGIVALTYGIKSRNDYFISFLVFLLMNFVFAGLMMAFESFVKPLNITYKNGAAYFDISFFAIVISTIAAYAVIRLIRFIIDSRTNMDKKYQILASLNGETVILKAFADTGNNLYDLFSGLPIIICEKEAIKKIIPSSISEYMKNKDVFSDEIYSKTSIRLVPCSTVTHTGIIPVFKPERLAVYSDTERKEIEALIGVSGDGFPSQDYSCIFNPKIL